jgi:hypothetical protein
MADGVTHHAHASEHKIVSQQRTGGGAQGPNHRNPCIDKGPFHSH